MIVERFDIERLRLCVKLMISESVSQCDIVLGIIVCPCEVEGYFRQGWEYKHGVVTVHRGWEMDSLESLPVTLRIV